MLMGAAPPFFRRESLAGILKYYKRQFKSFYFPIELPYIQFCQQSGIISIITKPVPNIEVSNFRSTLTRGLLASDHIVPRG